MVYVFSYTVVGVPYFPAIWNGGEYEYGLRCGKMAVRATEMQK